MNLDHAKTILWLRIRLTNNQLSRGGPANLIFKILGIAVSAILALGALVGGFAFAFFNLRKPDPFASLGTWDGAVAIFLFYWTIGFVTQIQRAETLNIEKFLHLPLSLSQVFLLNYLASLFTLSLIVHVPLFAGLCAGSISHLGPLLIFQVFMVISFLFMITSWTYCLRGWLTALMVSPRKRRTIVTLVGLAFFLITQIPMLFFQSSWLTGNAKHLDWPSLMPTIAAGHAFVPFGWPGLSAMRLSEGDFWPAIEFTAAATLLGVAALSRSYFSTLRFYRGENAPAKASSQNISPIENRSPSNIWKIPFVSEEVSAVAVKNFRCLFRSPEIKMAIFVPFFLIVIVAPFQLMKRFDPASRNQVIFALAAAAVLPFVVLLQLNSNLFGVDRDGFRALLLSPAKREDILLGKNLSVAPWSFGLSLGCLIMLIAFGRISWRPVPAALLQFTSAFLLTSLVANFVSIVAPYRINPGTMRATKLSGFQNFVQLLVHGVFPLAFLPIAVPAVLDWTFRRFNLMPWFPVHFTASLLLFLASWSAYRLLMPLLGRLLLLREQKILLTVTREME